MLIRIQDAILQRSLPKLSTSVLHGRWDYSVLRRQTVALVCVTASCLDSQPPPWPYKGPVTAALGLVRLLHMAATCLIEEIGNTETTTRGETLVTMEEEWRLRPTNGFSRDFRCVLQRLTYIADTYGDRYAAEVVSILDRRHTSYNTTRL